MSADREALAAFYDAMDSGPIPRGDYDRSRTLAWIDTNVDIVVESLTAAGWRPPESAADAEERGSGGSALLTLAEVAQALGDPAMEPSEVVERVREMNHPRNFTTTASAGLVPVSPLTLTPPSTPAPAPEDGAARRTQRRMLLDAWQSAGPEGMTDEEAAQAAGLWGTHSCWWHRATDLRADGWIEHTARTRMGAMGRPRKVSVVVLGRKGGPR